MAFPEQQPELTPDQQVTEIPSQPEVPAAVEQAGVQAVPSQVQPVADDSGQVVAQPVPAPPGQSISIPATSQQALTQMAKGPAANSQTWFGVFWLRKIKKALSDGLLILFGGGK